MQQECCTKLNKYSNVMETSTLSLEYPRKKSMILHSIDIHSIHLFDIFTKDKIGNNSINANFVFINICSLLNYFPI